MNSRKKTRNKSKLTQSISLPKLQFHSLTPSRWPDLESLFGERGACGGCWCMWWRMTRSRFHKQKGEPNRRAFKKIVDSGKVPGLLAYAQRKPIAWCAVAPRESYSLLERSRTLARVDDRPVWSVVCFFVAKPWRRQGVTRELLRAAAQYAKKHGARILEGYPIEPRQSHMPDAFAWTGFADAFLQAGFVEVLRRSNTRPIMRHYIIEK